MNPILQRFIRQALARKRRGDRALLALLRWLMEWDNRNRNLWRLVYRSFGALLDHHNILSKRTYARYRRACRALGVDTVENIGLDAACQIARLSTNNDQQAAARRVLIWIRDEGQGAFPSKQRVVVLIREVFPHFTSRARARVQRVLNALQEENQRLRAENARLQAEVNRLNARLATARKTARRSAQTPVTRTVRRPSSPTPSTTTSTTPTK